MIYSVPKTSLSTYHSQSELATYPIHREETQHWWELPLVKNIISPFMTPLYHHHLHLRYIQSCIDTLLYDNLEVISDNIMNALKCRTLRVMGSCDWGQTGQWQLTKCNSRHTGCLPRGKTIIRMRTFHRKMADGTYGFQWRECWISAMERFQRKTHKFFDLRCLLSMWQDFQDEQMLQRWDVT